MGVRGERLPRRIKEMSRMNSQKTDFDINAIEQFYGITLDEEDRMLLGHGPFTPIEKQRRYLLGNAVAPVQCPACLSTICQHQAAGGRKVYGNEHVPDDAYQCPRCGTRLVWYVELIGGGQGFTVHPDDARPVITPKAGA
jgi:hypothetical protein